ncbi:MAG: signal recognition particle-docking protein FtsY [Sphaerochaeta sp.]|jgi:fused signal recognition particle receptor|nr:signal recognition particle-docking protein FtsY [Sphaerochaeta sp.]MCH3920670.1 signal recognition particle-docking protein FtsY [Sphaerochaeta sp.]MCI2045115.1 signal recognition particle-docking protein FtsY [Sphaerochaeta sp.]MCI2076189.1 signal recognition particle-docking protein FtsY [Sphaerochaeta sp.]MCI2096760.1 signal recognition particle-docking protein FtsY [Sphaerochaeta sp.]
MFKQFGAKLKALFGIKVLDDSYYDNLEDLLIEGDLGPKMAAMVTDAVRKEAKSEKPKTQEELQQLVKKLLETKIDAYHPVVDPDKPTVFLMLGVNGVGKTTTIAKLARFYGNAGYDVTLCAADTFRAAAIDQLEIHAERLGIRCIKQTNGTDPGAVVFDAISSAQSRGKGLVLVDTAGRMHTKENLVRELAKIDKVVRAKGIDDDHYKRFLVIDSTTGQNGVSQAELFNQAVVINALVLSKYDSLAKGGALVQIGDKLHIPIAFVGTGEGYDDIHPFDKEEFLNTLVGLE